MGKKRGRPAAPSSPSEVRLVERIAASLGGGHPAPDPVAALLAKDYAANGRGQRVGALEGGVPPGLPGRYGRTGPRSLHSVGSTRFPVKPSGP